MKKILFIALFVTTASFAQKTINNYKYVIVPNKFDFVKGKDKYQTSSLTKFLFNKYGFTALLEDEKLPDDVVNNRCLALTGVVKDDSSLFTTKSIVELRDCYNKVVFTSQVGKSKEKDYKKAYHEAIRNAFKSVQGLKYTYIPSKEVAVVKKEVTAPVVSAVEVIKNKTVKTNEESMTKNVLYAQSITNGFQLVNTKPEVVFQVLKTNVKDVFVIKDKNGILYKNGDSWFAEYYKNGTKVTKQYQIKF
ncbi:hypothetical protein Q4517_04790 [Tenacibaculum sp. 1_MG-2023]|uniref:hypothetical protein n=1 Tax=Tenacibaculum sp. 1_MG-2023 TaxID=3062653 RepID=UPI0026E1F388|nr:hypothetical protein [Tenacibaculum sp. 1_MG-2023]MDO6674863.1 hypothetical protein [Tenacibaculum sp. 1_MG-2023]